MNIQEIQIIVAEEIKKIRIDELPAGFEKMNFTDLDLDSLTTIELIVSSMKKSNIKIPRDQFRLVKTPAELAEILLRHQVG